MKYKIRQQLDRIEHKLDQTLTRLEKLMALADDLKAGIDQLNTETDAVAANLAQLAGRITNSMTDQEVADIKAGLRAESDRLVTLGKDPTQTVPPMPPALLAARK